MRTAGDPAIAIRETLSIVRNLDPLVTPAPMQTIEETLGREMSAQRLGAYVLGALGGIAALLTVLGAYVLAESMAAARRREFSIRRALGATRARLSALVLAETVRLVGLGLLVGLVLAWMAAGTIGAFLFRVEPLDPVVLLSVSGAILVLSLLVSARAAVEAGRVDLTSLLKDE
jgi:ABC-type antimicrobial peptide transport system permease subunit